MLTISQAVEKVVKVKPFVTEALCEGLINISSLSRQIHPMVEKLTGKDVKQVPLSWRSIVWSLI